jgi:hypothetical protein
MDQIVYQREKSYKASRQPFAVNRPNWEYRDGQPPVCTIHDEAAVWHKNKARPEGGQWACRVCQRNKSRGQRRAWKTEHTDPFTYNLKRAFVMAKCHSKKIGRTFSIQFDDVLRMWDSQGGKCAITGEVLEYLPGNGERNQRKVTMDRIDSSRGYEPGNVWLLCDWANRAKTDMTRDQALAFARGIFRVFGG